MKKSVKIAGIVLGVGVVFFSGGIVGANMDWKTKAINDSYSKFLDTASIKVGELVGNVDKDLDLKVQSKVDGIVSENEEELERLLEEYYQMRLESIATTEEIEELELQIEEVRNTVVESYKKRINEAFNGR